MDYIQCREKQCLLLKHFTMIYSCKIYYSKYNYSNQTFLSRIRLVSVLPELTLPSKLVPCENIVKEPLTVDFAIQFGTNQERPRHFSM